MYSEIKVSANFVKYIQKGFSQGSKLIIIKVLYDLLFKTYLVVEFVFDFF